MYEIPKTRLVAIVVAACAVAVAWFAMSHGGLAPSTRQSRDAAISTGVEPAAQSAPVSAESVGTCFGVIARPAWVEYGSAADRAPYRKKLARDVDLNVPARVSLLSSSAWVNPALSR
jgi:hypothetical protein